MAFKCGFFNSINGDRKYNAEDMNKPYQKIVSDGVFSDSENSTDLQVVANVDMSVTVLKGFGKFFDKWCELDSDEIFTIPTPDIHDTRIDSIIVKIDKSNDVRKGVLEYRQGTNTPPILLNTDLIREYRLCNITVPANATNITQASIEDTRPSAECGFITNLLQNSDISATYSQWQAQFDEWFTNVRETLSSNTLIRSFTSRYVTSEQDEVTIPIGIPEYKSILDILQVYINGLLCFNGTDYVIDDYNNITLTNGVDKGTEIHFIVYKSMDGTGIDKFIEDVDDLIERQNVVESNFSNLENSNTSFKNGINTQISTINTNISNANTKINTNITNISKINTEITNLKKDPAALWTGANTMGDGVSITPSKKLSDCKNGWILIWCGYNTTDEIATNTRFNSVVIPKTLLASIPANYMPFYCNLAHNVYNSGNVEYNAKMVQIWDDKIVGFAGNVATDAGKGFCLKQVIEF